MNVSTGTLDVGKIRKDFPNLNLHVNGKPLAYLDNAATTFKPNAVIDVVRDHYKSGTSNVHRGIHTLSQQATDLYEKSREAVRAFINAPKSNQIIFTKGTTESINLIAQSYGRASLKEGDEVIITEMEHHSNIVPWQILCEENKCLLKIAPFNDAGELIYGELEKLLSDRTKMVSVVFVSNSLGTVNPVKKIIDAAHSKGAVVLLDAAQAVSHIPIDVQNLNCDFLAFSAHKLFGPTGVGILYGREELLNTMPPYQGGGDMIASVTFEKTTYNTIPHKFEAGTPNVAGVIGLGAAINYFTGIGYDKIEAYEQELLNYGTNALSTIDGLKLIGTAAHKVPVLSFIIPGIHAHDLGTLVDEEGVAIRTGHHCTQPVMKHFGVPATARASLSFYNTKEEIDQLVSAIKKAKKVFA